MGGRVQRREEAREEGGNRKRREATQADRSSRKE